MNRLEDGTPCSRGIYITRGRSRHPSMEEFDSVIDLVADVFFDFPKCELCQKHIAIIKTTTFKKYNNKNTVTFFECKCLYIKDLS